jgi:3-oxoacyl-[acyl-carrier protein] reductase
LNHNGIRLDGKKILITGVSRQIGIGATLAKRLAEAGAEIAIHGYSPYDLTVGTHNGAILNGTEKIADQYAALGLKVKAITPSDLETIGNAEKVVEEASEKLNGLDGMILNHAYGVDDEIGKWTAEHIDHHLLINVRASMMMIQSFAKQVDTTKR